MGITAEEAREQILNDLGAATDQIALAVASLGEAFEKVADGPGEVLEAELFRPAQKAYLRAKQTHTRFAETSGLPVLAFALPPPGPVTQDARTLIEQAATSTETADQGIAELQDSMLPIESGDAALRAGLGEIREILSAVPPAAERFLSTLGR